MSPTPRDGGRPTIFANSQSALAVLREGGSAIEAMVAAAATVAVVLPAHERAGRRWLLAYRSRRKGEPVAIDASGAAGSLRNARPPTTGWRIFPPRPRRRR